MKSVTIKKSLNPCNIIASIPHGSTKITNEMKTNLKKEALLTNNDWFLNELYDFLINLEITTISANYSRYVIDVNRDLNKKMNKGTYTESLIYLKNTFDKDIYHISPSIKEIEKRINEIYMPYHKTLNMEIKRNLEENEKVYLFDLHSFYIHSSADVVLGTKNCTNCSKELLNIVYEAFTAEGFEVKVDEKGLKGGHIVSYYSEIKNVEALQIEIRYTKYIENRYFSEEEIKLKDEKLFFETKKRLEEVFKKIKNSLDLI